MALQKKVLVVDDEPDVLDFTRLVLRKAGIMVITARDAQECLSKLEFEKTDLILLDVIMPGMNGYELCKKLKENPKTKDIPVALHTVLDRPQDREQAREVGADGFLSKPMTAEDIISFVKKVEVFFSLPQYKVDG